MHGVPPNDFPRSETGELFRLHSQISHAQGPEREAMIERHDWLEAKMRNWPRTAENDPFYVGSHELAERLAAQTGCDVIVGFNEFCGPSVEEAIGQAVERGAQRVITTTPMMTRGGEHSERDIASSVARAQEQYPHISMVYAWPFDVDAVAAFLAGHIAPFVGEVVVGK
jgi:sirohydrochlorin cobaltochelatase